MKSAKPAMGDASHRRSQPARQARTNPPRNRALGEQDGDSTGPSGDQPIDIFPAVTHFADTMTALPKELVRHFTLLKEVDAKIFGPEEQLFKLVAAATNPAAVSHPNHDTQTTGTTSSANPGNLVSSSSAAPDLVAPADGGFPSTLQLSSLPRQQLLRETSFKIHELLVSLEEKNHVLSTANEALQKQITRIEDVWPFLENEFSDEAKWGSTTHWAYPENRNGKSSHAERTRRDGAAAISAAAQALADEAAARSDARKQALQAKKSLKNNHLESDFDDHDGKATKGEGSKKSKARKTAAEGAVGLGITSGASTNGNPAPKKRKVEKPANGGTAAERAMAGVLGGANQPKAKTNSPRGTPAPDGPKKRKALPSASGQAKKSKNTPAGMSPSITSSPVIPPLPEPKTTSRASPAPNAAAAPRPPSSRSRQNSLHNVNEAVKSRPASAAANKPNGQVPPTPDSGAPKDWPRPGNEPKPIEKIVPTVKSESTKKEAEQNEKSANPGPAASKKEPKAEETERRNEPTPPLPPIPTVTTKSGRASKPSTPALATFQEAARSRPSRSGEKDSGGGTKKGHKKSGSTVQQAPPPPPPRVPDEDATSSAQGDDDDGDIDADEPRYCYCNGVSYGEMVACDSDDCEREWFHLACVGLKVAPGSKTKWYCEDCKERLKGARQRTNGR